MQILDKGSDDIRCSFCGKSETEIKTMMTNVEIPLKAAGDSGGSKHPIVY